MENPNRIWLASYAKSGTTWLRFLLTGLCERPPVASREVDRVVPSVHDGDRLVDCPRTGSGFFHTHQSFDRALAQFGPSAGLIYIVRHPLDVLLSNTRYFVLTQLSNYQRSQGRVGEPASQADLNRLAGHYVSEFLSHGGDSHGLTIGYGTWAHNVRSWLEGAVGQPSIVVRYEDLKREPWVEVARILAFLRVRRTRAQIRAAIEGASFSRMRQLENEEIAQRVEGRFYKDSYRAGHEAGLRFVHEGQVGSGHRELPAAVVERVASELERPMRALGYDLLNGQTQVEEPPPRVRAVRPLPKPISEYLTRRLALAS